MALKGMSRRDLAEASGVSYPFLCQILKDQKSPSYKAMTELAVALGFASASDMLVWGSKVQQLLEDA